MGELALGGKGIAHCRQACQVGEVTFLPWENDDFSHGRDSASLSDFWDRLLLFAEKSFKVHGRSGMDWQRSLEPSIKLRLVDFRILRLVDSSIGVNLCSGLIFS